jgi:N-dimethylarginine dimethylaminohydrolase
MERAYGSQSMVSPLRRVLVRRPDAAFAVKDPARWNYASAPDLETARREHDAFVAKLTAFGAEVLYHDAPQPDRADAIFVHDPAIVTDEGAIILRMGKDLRHGEEASLAARLEDLGVPILGTLGGDARAEGGDLLWIDHDTLAVGQGFRTNAAGLQQLGEILEPPHVDVLPVDLPYFHGPSACLHLMSLVSLVDVDLAVVYPRLLPVRLWTTLKNHGFDFIDVPDREFPSLGANVLALAPRRCVMLDRNPITQSRLEAVGCSVETYPGEEISLKAEGGATCLTRPILRAP